jgi:hypothetical protein
MTIITQQDRSTELLRVARVQPGYFSRQDIRPAHNGSHYLLQAKDVSPATGIQSVDLLRFHPQRQADLYQVSRGDILIASRGRAHHAYLIRENLVETLASSVFYIVRPCIESIVPAYLAWWLNLPHMQAQIDSSTRGTGIGYITRQTLECLPVVVPPIATQNKIAETLDLWQRQQSLQARLDQKREQLIHAICQQAVQQEKE